MSILLLLLLALGRLVSSQYAFSSPNGDLGERHPENDVKHGDLQDIRWDVRKDNELYSGILDENGHGSLWITSGLDQNFGKLIAGMHFSLCPKHIELTVCRRSGFI